MKTTLKLTPAALGALLLAAGSVHAATITVGPSGTYKTPCAAFAKAADGDTVTIDARGSYAGDVCFVPRSNLIIRGVNGRPKLDAAGKAAGGKGIWAISGNNVTVDNIEFTGAKVRDKNGAGIRLDGKLRLQTWARAQAQGMPVAEAARPLAFAQFPQGLSAGQWALRKEAERGGALGEGTQALWGAAFLAPRRLFDNVLWKGTNPLDWAFSRGMAPKIWTLGAILRCPIPQTPTGLADVEGFLECLENSGVRFHPGELEAADAQGRGVIARLMMRFSPPRAFLTLARMGCPPWARAPGDDPALKRALLTPNARGRHLFDALTEAAQAFGDGALQTLLGQRDSEGRGPMHWAAKALRADAIDFLARQGMDPNRRDARGDGAGHLALTARGPGQLAAQEQCVHALTRAGFDWRRAGANGELPIERAALKASPETLSVLLGQATQSYVDSPLATHRLAKRGGMPAALGQMAEMEVAAKPASSPAKNPRPRL